MPGFREHETPDDARLLRVSGGQDGAGRLVGGTAVPVLTEPEATTSGDEERAGVSGVGQAEVLVTVDVAGACSIGRQEIAGCGASSIGQVEVVAEDQQVGNGLTGCNHEHCAGVGRQSGVVVVADLAAIQNPAEADHVADTGSGHEVEAVLRDAQSIVGVAGGREQKDVEKVEDGAGIADFAAVEVETLGRRQIEQVGNVQEIGDEHAVADRNVGCRDYDLRGIGCRQREGRAIVADSHTDNVDAGFVDCESRCTGDILGVAWTDDDGVTSTRNAAIDGSLQCGERLIERTLVAVGTLALTSSQRRRAVVDEEDAALGIRENERHTEDREASGKATWKRGNTTLLKRGRH